MVTLTSSTQSADEMRAALEAHGQVVETPAVVDPPSVPPVAPGESPAPTGGETAPASEAGDKKPQDTQAAPPEPGTPKRDNFETRRKQLQRANDRLREDLDMERGDKGRALAELEAVKAELAALKPKEPAKADELVKPVRPKLADFDFDNDRYEAALGKYDDEDLPKYYKELSTRTFREETARAAEEDRKAQAQRESEAAFNSFVEKRDTGRARYEDYDELLEQLGDKIDYPEAMELAVLESENPADLIHHFMDDVVNQDGKELARFQKMSPVRQVRELAKLEDRLVSERESKAKPAGEQPKPAVVEDAPAAKPPEPPARPRTPAKPQIDPIEPVGSRSSAPVAHLGEAKSAMDYIRLRQAGVNRA